MSERDGKKERLHIEDVDLVDAVVRRWCIRGQSDDYETQIDEAGKRVLRELVRQLRREQA